MITVLTILNTLAIVYLILSKKSSYYVDMRKQTTFSDNTVVGYLITLWRKSSEYSASSVYCIYIPVKNRRKVELREEIQRMMKGNKQQMKYSLSARFSWLKTLEEVKQFEKDYLVVDEEFVKNLVDNFIPKK